MPPSPSVPLFEAQDLRCERDERLLFAGLGFRLHPGSVLQLAGPNGSGKTTLLRAVAGLGSRVEGEMRWRGELLPGAGWEMRCDSLYLGHEAAVKPGLSAIENLRWHVALWGRQRAITLEDALVRVGLGRYIDTPARQLSAGQKRRIALARLLLSTASLWILDEPFTAIDVAGVAQIEELIDAHARGGGAVILCTHHHLALGCPLERIDLGAEVTA